MATQAEVERALDSVPHRSGAIVVDKSMRLLAERPALPGGGAVLVVLDVEPFSYADPPMPVRAAVAEVPQEPRADAQEAPEDPSAAQDLPGEPEAPNGPSRRPGVEVI